MRVFAGPNGSGKSTIKGRMKPEWLGVYLNADDLEKDLHSQQSVALSPFGVTASTEELRSHCRASGHLKKPGASWTEDDTVQLYISGGRLFAPGKINSYLGASIVDFLRGRLMAQQESFSFETVMSHPSKVDFLRQAQQAGFRTYLYFVATDDPVCCAESRSSRSRKCAGCPILRMRVSVLPTMGRGCGPHESIYDMRWVLS